MGTFFIDEQGQRVGLCPKCSKIKPDFMLMKVRNRHNQFSYCHECNREAQRVFCAQWQVIRHKILSDAGGCMWPGCHMKYPRDFGGNFALDHIDPSLKQHVKETNATWVMHNQEEFWQRVFPNLQVLCQHHNGEKRNLEYGVGGTMHNDPWDSDADIIITDFNDLKPCLPGMEFFSNPLT